MGLTSELIGVGDPRWPAALERVQHDLYHLPAYVDLAGSHEGGDPAALLVEDGERGLLLPLVIRPIPGGGRDAISPYGYPGPLSWGTDDPAFLADAMRVGLEGLAGDPIVSVFIRFHPLINPFPPEGIGTVIRHGDTVTVDLSLGADLNWSQTRRDHRTQIRRSIAAGHRAFVTNEPRYMADFIRLYRATMERAGAAAYYRFDDDYFERFQSALGDRLWVAITEIEGEAVAAALLVETCGIVQSHLTGTDQRFSRQAPTKLLDHDAIAWSRDRGDRWFHLGGGRGGATDSLLEYKAGFSPLRTPFHTMRVVLLEDRYTELVVRHDPTLDSSDETGYFPLYRRPLAVPG